MNDALAQLAAANPVRAEGLTPLGVPDRFASRRLPRIGLGAAVAIAAAVLAVVGAFAFSGSNSVSGHGGLGQGNGDIPRLGLIGPTGAAGAKGFGVTGMAGPTGTEGPWRSGATAASGPTGSNGPDTPQTAGLSVGFDRTGTGGALKAVGVTVWKLKKTGFRLEVRYLGPPGNWKAPYPVVYRTTVLPDDMSSTTGSVGIGPSGRNGPGPTAWTWSGRLDPGDWKGGCQGGDYEIDLDWDTGGTFSVDVSTDFFQCTGN